MPFHESDKPSLVVPRRKFTQLVRTLSAAGFNGHDGRKVRRDGEIVTMLKKFSSKGDPRQCHVQIVDDGKHILVYAHTEPAVGRDLVSLLRHGISAVEDKASFSAGSRMLRTSLARQARKNRRG